MDKTASKGKKILYGITDFFRKYGLTILAIVLLIVIWQLVVDGFHIKKYVLPSPKLVFQSLFGPQAAKNHWWKHIKTTTTEVFGSFVLVMCLGVLLAVIISWNRWLNRLIMPVLVLFNSIPKIALAPLFLLWMGYGVKTNIWIAFFVAFFHIVINATTGMTSVDEDFLDLVRYLDASKLQIFIKVRIPASLPYIFSGTKICATSCVVGSIVGEFCAAKSGLGYLMRDAQANIDMATMFACLLMLAVIGMFLFALVSILEKVCMPWSRLRSEQ